MRSLPQIVGGQWTLAPGELPERVTLGAAVFRLSPLGERDEQLVVVAHYREEVDEDSRHLWVLDDNTWRITHEDAFNPDAGAEFHAAPYLLPHALADTWWAAPGLAALALFAAFVVALAILLKH